MAQQEVQFLCSCPSSHKGYIYTIPFPFQLWKISYNTRSSPVLMALLTPICRYPCSSRHLCPPGCFQARDIRGAWKDHHYLNLRDLHLLLQQASRQKLPNPLVDSFFPHKSPIDSYEQYACKLTPPLAIEPLNLPPMVHLSGTNTWLSIRLPNPPSRFLLIVSCFIFHYRLHWYFSKLGWYSRDIDRLQEGHDIRATNHFKVVKLEHQIANLNGQLTAYLSQAKGL